MPFRDMDDPSVSTSDRSLPRPPVGTLTPTTLEGQVALLVLWHRSSLALCSTLGRLQPADSAPGLGMPVAMVSDRAIVQLSDGERHLWDAARVLCVEGNPFSPVLVSVMDQAQPSDLDAIRRAVRAWLAASDVHDVIRDVL